jgi:hypothetical protein
MGWKVAVYTNPQSIKVRYRWDILIKRRILTDNEQTLQCLEKHSIAVTLNNLFKMLKIIFL